MAGRWDFYLGAFLININLSKWSVSLLTWGGSGTSLLKAIFLFVPRRIMTKQTFLNKAVRWLDNLAVFLISSWQILIRVKPLGNWLRISIGFRNWQLMSVTSLAGHCDTVFWIFYKATRQRNRYVSSTVWRLLFPYNSEKNPNCHNCNVCITEYCHEKAIFCLLVFLQCFTISTKGAVRPSLSKSPHFISIFVFQQCKLSKHYENGRTRSRGYNPSPRPVS